MRDEEENCHGGGSGDRQLNAKLHPRLDPRQEEGQVVKVE